MYGHWGRKNVQLAVGLFLCSNQWLNVKPEMLLDALSTLLRQREQQGETGETVHQVSCFDVLSMDYLSRKNCNNYQNSLAGKVPQRLVKKKEKKRGEGGRGKGSRRLDERQEINEKIMSW